RVSPHAISTLFPYTTLFRSDVGNSHQPSVREGSDGAGNRALDLQFIQIGSGPRQWFRRNLARWRQFGFLVRDPGDLDAQREQYRSEEHTSELQSRENLVCRL